jgi:uncharacterized membrane protein (UPF0127 family)
MNKGNILINKKLFDVLLALSEQEQSKGLMNAEHPVPNMAFVYGQPRINKFWMHNTKIPLDIVFSCNGIVSQICVGQPHSTALIGDDKPSDLIVEFPLGVVGAAGIKIGDNIELQCDKDAQMKILMLKSGFLLS